MKQQNLAKRTHTAIHGDGYEPFPVSYLSNLVRLIAVVNNKRANNGSGLPMTMIQPSLVARRSTGHSRTLTVSAVRVLSQSDKKSIRERTIWV